MSVRVMMKLSNFYPLEVKIISKDYH